MKKGELFLVELQEVELQEDRVSMENETVAVRVAVKKSDYETYLDDLKVFITTGQRIHEELMNLLQQSQHHPIVVYVTRSDVLGNLENQKEVIQHLVQLITGSIDEKAFESHYELLLALTFLDEVKDLKAFEKELKALLDEVYNKTKGKVRHPIRQVLIGSSIMHEGLPAGILLEASKIERESILPVYYQILNDFTEVMYYGKWFSNEQRRGVYDPVSIKGKAIANLRALVNERGKKIIWNWIRRLESLEELKQSKPNLYSQAMQFHAFLDETLKAVFSDAERVMSVDQSVMISMKDLEQVIVYGNMGVLTGDHGRLRRVLHSDKRKKQYRYAKLLVDNLEEKREEFVAMLEKAMEEVPKEEWMSDIEGGVYATHEEFMEAKKQYYLKLFSETKIEPQAKDPDGMEREYMAVIDPWAQPFKGKILDDKTKHELFWKAIQDTMQSIERVKKQEEYKARDIISKIARELFLMLENEASEVLNLLRSLDTEKLLPEQSERLLTLLVPGSFHQILTTPNTQDQGFASQLLGELQATQGVISDPQLRKTIGFLHNISDGRIRELSFIMAALLMNKIIGPRRSKEISYDRLSNYDWYHADWPFLKLFAINITLFNLIKENAEDIAKSILAAKPSDQELNEKELFELLAMIADNNPEYSFTSLWEEALRKVHNEKEIGFEVIHYFQQEIADRVRNRGKNVLRTPSNEEVRINEAKIGTETILLGMPGVGKTRIGASIAQLTRSKEGNHVIVVFKETPVKTLLDAPIYYCKGQRI